MKKAKKSVKISAKGIKSMVIRDLTEVAGGQVAPSTSCYRMVKQ